MKKVIFAIESSCDETAAAIVIDGTIEVSSSLATSKELHEKTGGVVPEVAARKQLEFMLPVIEDCLKGACNYFKDPDFRNIPKFIDAVAVTVGPGLAGSLVVGVEAAKALSLAWEKPLIPVNHLIGHIYANYLGKVEDTAPEFPALALVVSGGHTDLVLIKNHYDFEYLGGTLDDAAGECFDKSARLLGISDYLGGVLLSKEAEKSQNSKIIGSLPRPLINEDNYDFSFSGLKTAVKRYHEKNPNAVLADLCCEIEDSIVDILVEKTTRAANEYKVKNILVGGGVSANTKLRKILTEKSKVPVFFPEPRLCTDNAIYIASAAFFRPESVENSKIEVNPSLSVTDII